MTNLKEKKYETLLKFGLLAALFIFMAAWAYVQPFNASPDEVMRYDIIEYLIEHGTIPDGRDPEIRNELWGISYAYSPILAYMIMAIPGKIVTMLGGSFTAVLMACRMVNVCFGTASAYLIMRIGEMLFKGKEKWMFFCMATFLPQVLFVNSYVNNDSMALFSVAWIVYAWVRSLKEGWTTKICVHLALAISVCGLSYYNAYGFVLCSILFLGATILFCDESGKKDFRLLFKKGGLISVIVIVLIGWWFIRNAILYDGDFLGWNISTEYAEMYAMEELKPSNRQTPQNMGMSVWQMIKLVPGGWEHNWLITVAVSFIGTFGFMDIFMPFGVSRVYIVIFALGMAGILIHYRATFFPKVVKIEKTKEKQENVIITQTKQYLREHCSKEAIFHLCMFLAMIIPFCLLVRYSYANDFQAQGRYILPMLIPFMYFITYGYGKILNKWVKNEKIHDLFYIGISVLSIIGVVYTYFGVFLPSYM